MKVGIVGLPNVGKSTLFQAITKKKVDISNYPFCTINPNLGITEVPDPRLEKIKEVIKPKKTVPAIVEFLDIAGLIKNAHKGEGLGNQFLSHIYEADAMLLIIRCFEDKKIIHVENEINPEHDYQTIKTELTIKDQKLAEKPALIICNIKNDGENKPFEKCDLKIDFKLELEASEMEIKDLEELNFKSKLPELITLAYETLNLITFYTIKGGAELRASPLEKGKFAPEAGGKIHGDFKEKFIRAEVINYNDFINIGGWNKAREKGILRTEGKEYVVQDGDIIEFKI